MHRPPKNRDPIGIGDGSRPHHHPAIFPEHQIDWRWPVGGPIMDFGDDGIEAGTSYQQSSSTSPSFTPPPPPPPPPPSSRRRRSRPKSTSSSSLLPIGLILLSFTPFTSALPPLVRSPQPETTLTIPSNTLSTSFLTPTLSTPTESAPTPIRTILLEERVIHVPTPIPTPILPTKIIAVPETLLPYYLSQAPNGVWEKIDHAWLMFGRRARYIDDFMVNDTTSTSYILPSPAVTSYAITEALPTGWGSTPERSSFYKVPLIVVSSVVLAFLIVASIAFITIRRHKAIRRKKREETRLRRQALKAAGLTEDDIAGSIGEAAFRAKLVELENEVKSRRRKKPVPSSVVRTRVRVWSNGGLSLRGLRKRKNKKSIQGGGDVDIIGTEKFNSVENLPESGRRETRSMVMNTMQANEMDTSSASLEEISASNSDRRRPGSFGAGSHLGQGLNQGASPVQDGSFSNASSNQSANDRFGTVVSSSPISPDFHPHSSFPPAYRPASVASVGRGNSVTAHEDTNGRTVDALDGPALFVTPPTISPPAPPFSDKTREMGSYYYPAPTTEEAEVALAVAGQSDGKSRHLFDLDNLHRGSSSAARSGNSIRACLASNGDILDPYIEGEQGSSTRHVATDDKRELERIRLAGSAPPVREGSSQPETEGEASPSVLGVTEASAPTVDLDETGFERPVYEERSSTGHPVRTVLAISTREAGAHVILSHGDETVPPPPILGKLRTFDIAMAPSSLPFAPTRQGLVPEEEDENIAHLIPSAPPVHVLIGREGESEEQGRTESMIPSAPAFFDDEEDEGEVV